MEITKKGDIHEISMDYSGKKWEQWVLLMSDEHFDSPDCDRNLLRKHHERALERNAFILKFGDVFDCMGGKYDPRTQKGDIRPEHVRKDYFSYLQKDAAKFYKKYPIAFISDGNHEENVLNRHEVDLIGDLAQSLKCERGEYSGYIRFRFHNKESAVRKIDMYYNHGSGGNSPVTKGTIQTNRRGVAFDADILVSGHNHNRWMMELRRQYVNDISEIKAKSQHHINLGTYKNMGGRTRFESGFPAPNMGGCWLRFYTDRTNGNRQISYEVTYA